jgi:hypothetical protein
VESGDSDDLEEDALGWTHPDDADGEGSSNRAVAPDEERIGVSAW